MIISEDKLNNIYFSHLEKTKILKFSDESIVEIEIPSYYHNMNALYHVEDLRFISDHRFRWVEGYVDSDYVDPDYFEDEDYFD